MENHEDIYAVHRDGEKLDGSEERKFYFMEVSDDIWKYTNNPAVCFFHDLDRIFIEHLLLQSKFKTCTIFGINVWKYVKHTERVSKLTLLSVGKSSLSIMEVGKKVLYVRCR